MTDEKFAKWILQPHDTLEWDKFLRELSVTPSEEQMGIICENIKDKHGYLAEILNESFPLSESQVSILLSSNSIQNLRSMFQYVSELTPSHIKFGLSHHNRLVQLAAYHHPKCSDEIKVWFHLTYGEFS